MCIFSIVTISCHGPSHQQRMPDPLIETTTSCTILCQNSLTGRTWFELLLSKPHDLPAIPAGVARLRALPPVCKNHVIYETLKRAI